MADYLALCNKVIAESANELDELDYVSWFEPEAGRRLYPRIKRMVAEAWRALQMERDEWEFKSKELNLVGLLPKIKVYNGDGVFSASSTYKGEQSGAEISIVSAYPSTGDWGDGDWKGQLAIEVETTTGYMLIPGEKFVEVTPTPGNSSFYYEQKGSYDVLDFDPLMREIRWDTMVVSQDGLSPTPCIFIPWNNWIYKELSFTQGSRTVPTYYSQDFEGNLVFYPQTLDPFNVSVVYDTAPQELVEPDDEPILLKEEYHDWIAWKALENIAQYDKNPTLYAYAHKWAEFYKGRADKELMPVPSWGYSRFEGSYW